jgi:Tol biopolymer transport system component
MPAYEGEPLSARLGKTPMGIADAIDIGAQVASGLARAHEKSIVHRDLKPDNIFVTRDGQAKIVDFGIAKLTTQPKLTRTGRTLGTVSHMSPEQVRGEEVDHRSDVFSLGVVLYEILTGELPFKGDHEASIIYNITTSDPDPLDKTRKDVPDALQEIVDRSLQKDTGDRYQSADDLRRDLESLGQAMAAQSNTGDIRLPSSGTSLTGTPSVRWGGLGRRVIVGAIVVLVIATLAIWNILTRTPSEDGEHRERLAGAPHQIALKQITFDAGVEEYPTFSPDASQIAYSLEVQGFRQIFVKDLPSGSQHRITEGSNDNIQPDWSPDGNVIVFVRSHRRDGKLEPGDVFGVHSGGDIWRFDLAVGKEIRIVEDAFNPSFSPDGRQIAFDASWAGPRRIWIADDAGRNPQQITFDDSEAVDHIVPRWSPDGSRLVFQSKEGTSFDIKTVDVTTRQMHLVTQDRFSDLNPVWAGSGDAVYFTSNRSGGLNVWRIVVGADGSSTGAPQQVTTGAGRDAQLAISADGSTIAMSILRLNADLWRVPVSSKNGRPTGEPEALIATTREDSRGAWSPDGTRIAFNSDRTGDMNIWVYSFADAGATQVTRGPGGDYQPRWSSDGQRLVFFSARSGNADIWAVDIDTGTLTQLTQDECLEINPFYSPNEKHIAYHSDHDGRRELWVMNADGSNQRQLTHVGASGHFMLWSGDSERIVFSASGVGAMWVPVEGGDAAPLANVIGRAHMSFSPDEKTIMDVTGHRTLWASPLSGGEPISVFEFEDPDARIDYPVWSPEGQWILFDRVKPQGGDIWLIENLE